MSRALRTRDVRREPLLFPPRPGANRTRTSRRAADAAAPKAPTCRERILAFLRTSAHGGPRGLGHWHDGATHEEIAAALSIRLDTVKPRVHELGELGLVVALRETRTSTAGAEVLVFVAAEHAGDRPLEPWPTPPDRLEVPRDRPAATTRRRASRHRRPHRPPHPRSLLMTGPSKQFSAFPAVTCERIRRLVALRQKCETERKAQFTARDHAYNERARTAPSEKTKRARLEADYGIAVMEIEVLKNTIKWANDEIERTVESADDGKLWNTADLDVPDFRAPKDEDEDEDADDGVVSPAGPARPVGRPGPVRPVAPEPALGVGIDDHLKASVNELDCRKDLKGKLIKAGLTTIGMVAAMIDARRDLREKVDCGEKIASEIKRAVESFRSRHRKAMMAQEAGS